MGVDDGGAIHCEDALSADASGGTLDARISSLAIFIWSNLPIQWSTADKVVELNVGDGGEVGELVEHTRDVREVAIVGGVGVADDVDRGLDAADAVGV